MGHSVHVSGYTSYVMLVYLLIYTITFEKQGPTFVSILPVEIIPRIGICDMFGVQLNRSCSIVIGHVSCANL